MSNLDIIALLPFIILSSVILLLMLVVAYARNLTLSCAVSVLGLMLTLGAIVWVNLNYTGQMVTPLLLVDAYALLFSGLIVLASLFIALVAHTYKSQRGDEQDEFYILLLLSTLGGVTLAHSAHFASFILGLELLGVAIYAMISYPKQGLFSLEAALKYLILSGVSSAFILFGIALLYAILGSLSFVEIAQSHYQQSGYQRLFVLIGSALLLSGIGFKLSLVPFHMWTPDVYEGAPAPVTAFLATVSKGAIFVVLLRFFLMVDGFQYPNIMTGLFWLAILSILGGNLLALLQTSIKRLLAYSSIAHFGYLMVAFIAIGAVGGKQLAIEATAIFLIAYFLTTLGAFGVVTIMAINSQQQDQDSLAHYQGLFWRRPILALFFTAMLLSLAGIPLTAGFIGKFYIVAVAVDGQLWGLLIAVIVGSGIGLFYYLRVIFAMTQPSTSFQPIVVPHSGIWALAGVTLALLMLGVYPAPVIQWVNAMANTMI